MSEGMTALLLVVAGLLAGLSLGYALAWWVVGHEPLLARNCTCTGRKR